MKSLQLFHELIYYQLLDYKIRDVDKITEINTQKEPVIFKFVDYTNRKFKFLYNLN